MADKKISDLATLGSALGTDLFEVAKAGVDNYKVTLDDLADIFAAIIPNLDDISGLVLTGNAGKVLTVNPGGTALVLATPSGGGVTSHLDLSNIGTMTHAQLETALANLNTDIGNLSTATSTALAGKQASSARLTDLAALSYASNALKVVRVNAGATAFELATAAGSPPAFSAIPTTTQTVTTGTATKLNLGNELLDSNTNFAASRFTPTIAGYYQINGMLRATATNLTACFCSLYVNGAAYRQGGTLNTAAVSGAQHVVINELVYLNGSGDYIELWGLINGTSPSFLYTSDSQCSAFSGYLVRP